jgi:hypothetical protein
MNSRVSRYLRIALICAIGAFLVAGCGKKDDPVAQAEKKDVAKGVPAPGIAETKAIAEEAFIYGLPLVMNYAVMNEFVIDKNSGQYKAPFNTIFNETRVFTYKDTAVVTPNSDTPYSMLWLDLRAEPIVISVPAVPKERYYSVQLVDGNTYNYGYIGSRATGFDARCPAADIAVVVSVAIGQLHRVVTRLCHRRHRDHHGLRAQIEPEHRIGRVAVWRGDACVLVGEYPRLIDDLVEWPLVLT